jgi:taurine--2-oxoglutarate transaminase
MTTTHGLDRAGGLAERLDALTEQEVRALDREHVFHSWSAQGAIDPLPIARAQGSYFWDYSGRRYLDFSSQLVNINIGYQHPKIIAATHAARPPGSSPTWPPTG